MADCQRRLAPVQFQDDFTFARLELDVGVRRNLVRGQRERAQEPENQAGQGLSHGNLKRVGGR